MPKAVSNTHRLQNKKVEKIPPDPGEIRYFGFYTGQAFVFVLSLDFSGHTTRSMP